MKRAKTAIDCDQIMVQLIIDLLCASTVTRAFYEIPALLFFEKDPPLSIHTYNPLSPPIYKSKTVL